MITRSNTRLLLAVMLFLGVTLLSGCSKQQRASRHVQRADKYFAAGEFEKAEIEYLNVIRLDRTNRTAIRNLGEIYFTRESFQRAGGFLSMAKQLDPNDAESRGKLARLMLASGAVKQARVEADEILRISPTNENALLILADSTSNPQELKTNQQRIAALKQKAGNLPVFHVVAGIMALKQRDTNTAAAELKAAVDLDPKSPTANQFLGGFYLDQRNVALAEPHLKAAAELSPLRSQRRLKYAALKAQTGDMAAAKTQIAEITSKAADYIPAWIVSARLALTETNYSKCLEDLKVVLQRDPDNFDALSIRSDVEVAQGNVADAVKTLEILVSKYPKSPLAQYQLGVAAIRNKDVTRGLAALNQSVALDPQYTPAVLALAELNIRRGETAPAIASLTQVIKTYPQLEKAYILLGAAYSSARRYNDALATYNQVQQKFPRNAEVPYLVGVTLKQQGRPTDARKVFEQIVTNRPNDRIANLELIALDLQATNYTAAIQRAEQWMQRDPKDVNPVFELGKIRYNQKDIKGAEALFQKVIQMDPNAIGAYVLLARIYMDSNQLDAALEKASAAVTRNPRDVGALLLTGLIYENKGQYDKARDAYETLLNVNPQHVIALNNLAVVYAERFNQLDKAYPLARKALDLVPTHPSIADTFGWILSLRGDYALALGQLKEAVEGLPTDPDAIAHLGITQYLAGDEAGARTSLENALKLSQNFTSRERVQQCLAILNINPASADAAAISALEKRLLEKPDDQVAVSKLAAIYERSNNPDKVVSLYEKALAANPKLALLSAKLAEITSSRLKNDAKALELAKSARKMDASDPEIAHIAGRLASKSSDLNDQQWGLSLLSESFQKLPRDPNVAFHLGWAQYIQGRTNEAQASMKSVLANGANLPIAASARHLLDFMPLTEPSRASSHVAQIDQALKSDPDYLPALVARAAAAQQSGDTALALKTLDHAITKYPGFGPAIRSAAILSAGRPGDTSKAITFATRARDLYRDDPEVLKALGIIQYQRGEFQNAANSLSSAAQKRSDDETVQYYLGMSYYKLKQTQQSKTALQKALTLKPQAPFAADAQRILKELK